ncbi:glycerate kinase [Paenibacillus sp. GCM10027626]|uniref:glycerate kinase n=1 Tax=Paenibacillus sp. GCM10027626 TaxID=3273411 RepID=UPI003638A9BF
MTDCKAMRIVLAPDSYKGSLESLEVAEAMEAGIRRVIPHAEVIKIPIADGGEGTVDAVLAAVPGERRTVTAKDPLGRPVQAAYALLADGTAVIETAAASGLPLLERSERDALKATTYGTGELVRDALDAGCRRIVIGLGGSATTDGGMGLGQALGYRFLDGCDNELGYGGGELEKLAAIDASAADPRLAETEVILCCDVTNPLYGAEGAAHIFAPQKGANAETVARLDRGLRRYAAVLRRSLGAHVHRLPGAGAAGGLGAGAAALLHAALRPGFDLLAGITRLEEAIVGAGLVLTGEGRTDGQTACGKAPAGVAGLARKHGVPAVCLSGGLGPGADALYAQGVTALMSIVDGPMSLDDALAGARPLLERAAENAVRLFAAARAAR